MPAWDSDPVVATPAAPWEQDEPVAAAPWEADEPDYIPGAAEGQLNTAIRAFKGVQQMGNLGKALIASEILDPDLAFKRQRQLTGVDNPRSPREMTTQYEARLDELTRRDLAAQAGTEQTAVQQQVTAAQQATAGRVFPASLERIGELQREISAIQESADVQAYQQAPGFLAKMGVIAENPIELPLNIAIRGGVGSLPAIATAAAGGLTAGPAGAAAGAGIGSFATEYLSSILGSMGRAGVDLEDPASLATAFANPEFMRTASAEAATGGIPVAVFDALSARIGGALVNAARSSGGSLIRAGAAEGLQQATLGAGGESAKQVVTGRFDPVAIVEEALGEVAGGARDIVQPVVQQAFQQASAEARAIKQQDREAEQAQKAAEKAAKEQEKRVKEAQRSLEQIDEQRQGLAQQAQQAAQAVEQASGIIADAQAQDAQAKQADVASIDAVLADPKAATLDLMVAKQQALADAARASVAAKAEASQSLEQATGILEQAAQAEQQAGQSLAQLDAAEEQILRGSLEVERQAHNLEAAGSSPAPAPTSQAGTPLAGLNAIPQEPLGGLQEIDSGGLQPALAQPAGPDLESVAPLGELLNAPQIPELAAAPAQETPTLDAPEAAAEIQPLNAFFEMTDGRGHVQLLRASSPEAAAAQWKFGGQPTAITQMAEPPANPDAPSLADFDSGLVRPGNLLDSPQVRQAAADLRSRRKVSLDDDAAIEQAAVSQAPRPKSSAEQWADRVIAEQSKRLSSGIDPQLLAAYAVKGVAVLERGIRDVAAWSAEMVSQFGEKIRPHLDAIYKRATEAFAGIDATLPEADRRADSPASLADAERSLAEDNEDFAKAAKDLGISEEDHQVATEVLGNEVMVNGRRQLTPEERERAKAHATAVAKEAGFEVVYDEGQRLLSLVDENTANESAGQKFLDLLKREMLKNPFDPSLPLLNELADFARVTLYHSPRVLSQGLRNDIFAIAQGRVSMQGLLLGAHGGFQRTLNWVARHVDTVLQYVWGQQFGGDTLGQVLDRARTEIERQEQESVTPKNETPTARKKRRRTALEKVVDSLDPAKRRAVRKSKTLWGKLVEFAEAGLFDKAELLKQIAIANGWTVPTEAQLQQMRDWAKREAELRTPTAQDVARYGTDPTGLRDFASDLEAATLEERAKLKQQMQTMWTRFTKPIGYDSKFKRENLARAASEFVAANLLFKIGFGTRQLIDVATQAVIHTPGRAVSAALVRYQNDKSGGRETRAWRDIGEALKEAYAARLKAFGSGRVYFVEALKGRREQRNVDRLLTGIRFFDRMSQRADELSAAGEHAKSAMLRLTTFIGLSFRVASAFDNAHGALVEAQEIRAQAVTKFREMGYSPTQARLMGDAVVVEHFAEWQMAIGRAKQIFDDRGINPKPNELKAAAWDIVRSRQYARMQVVGLPAEAFRESNRILRDTIGWNMPEKSGVGGMVGKIVAAPKEFLGGLGIPWIPGTFSNAIAIGINRTLTFTPLGFYQPLIGGEQSAWLKTREDRMQRRVESTVGTAVGSALFGLALAGLLRVWSSPPRDKEERDKWEREGHRAGTVEVNVGDGKFIPFSLSSGPFSAVRPYLAAAGAIQDAQALHDKRQRTAEQEARRKGVTAAPVSLALEDLAAIGLAGAWTSLAGGRTAGGLTNAYYNPSEPNFRQPISGFVSPLIPLLPGAQEAQRARGIRVDPKRADVIDLMFPRGGTPAQRVNFLGDDLNPNDVQRIVQTFTGGNFPGIVDPKTAQDTKPYRLIYRAGWNPPTISHTEAYAIGGELRQLTNEEIARMERVRGQLLKDEFTKIDETEINHIAQESGEGDAGMALNRYLTKIGSAVSKMALEKSVGATSLNWDADVVSFAPANIAARLRGLPRDQAVAELDRLISDGEIPLDAQGQPTKEFADEFRRAMAAP